MVSLAAQATRREMEKRCRFTKTCKFLRKLAMYADDAARGEALPVNSWAKVFRVEFNWLLR
jgi:hypothetical protein